MCDIDWENFEYGIFIGTCPGSSGESLNRLGFGVAEARTARKAEYVCVDPILRNPVANGTGASWLPIIPGTDTAFLYGVVRTIIENKWYDEKFLRNPSKNAAKAAGEINWSNATWLVNLSTGEMADAAQLGLGKKGDGVVVSGGKPIAAARAKKGSLEAELQIRGRNGKKSRYVTSFLLLKREAFRHSLEDYSRLCGIPVASLEEVAKKFTHHGRRVAACMNTGNYTADAPMASWLICILNTLVGAHDAKGGAIYGNGAWTGFEGRYDLSNVKGAPKLDGVVTACLNLPYEDSTEYKRRKAAGNNPYPARHVYHNMSSDYGASNAAELLTAAANRSPYAAKALFTWRSNPVYAASSFSSEAVKALSDPKKLPLYVSIDAFINETNTYADYIIPDHVMYEDYACDRTWGSFDQCVVAGAPVAESRTVKDSRGRHVCMENFLIDLAKTLKLPGFGRGAIPVKGGRGVDLESFEDWSVRFIANVAAQCKGLPKVTESDRKFAGLEYAMKGVKGRVTAKESAAIESLFSRGGFYAHDSRYEGNFLKNGGGKFLQLYNPAMAALRNQGTGKAYPGVPVLDVPRFFNGKPWSEVWPADKYPLRLSSYKPILRSPYSVAFKRNALVSPQNFIYVNEATAEKLGLKNGDRAKLVSPNGLSAAGILRCDKGVAEGAVCVAHGFGHTGYGATACEIDGKTIPGDKVRGGGIAVNRLIPQDPTRPGAASLLNDVWAFGNCRSGIPMRIEKA
ncbi:MAG: molybdopterin-dependent oxidoreductase [Sutterellaceae bacterium]|nr:molybdopterin-dependent oxidoreductase [Sutterellaceae bacterium]